MNPHSQLRNHASRNFGQAPGDLAAGGLTTGDLAKARVFYDGLHAWEFREVTPEDPAAGCLPKNSCHAGADQKQGQGQGGAMVLGGATVLELGSGGAGSRPSYFQVDDLDGVVARVWELGGEIVVPPTDTPDGPGSFCIVRDPCGATIGLWQARAAESCAV